MIGAAKRKSSLLPGLAALRLVLLLIVTLCLGETRVWGFGITSPSASGVFESVTLSPIGENTIAWQYDASDSPLAARGTPRTNFNIYESLAEVPLSGTSRGAHRNAANRAFAQQLEASPELQRMFNQQLGGDVLQHMNSGAGRSLLNPPGVVWHHPIDNPGVLRLLRQGEHTNPLLQPVLHPGPNRTGGFGTHFGGN